MILHPGIFYDIFYGLDQSVLFAKSVRFSGDMHSR